MTVTLAVPPPNKEPGNRQSNEAPDSPESKKLYGPAEYPAGPLWSGMSRMPIENIAKVEETGTRRPTDPSRKGIHVFSSRKTGVRLLPHPGRPGPSASCRQVRRQRNAIKQPYSHLGTPVRTYGRLSVGKRTAPPRIPFHPESPALRRFRSSADGYRRADDRFHRRQSTGVRQDRPLVAAKNRRRWQGLCATVPACDRAPARDVDGTVSGSGSIERTVSRKILRSTPAPFRPACLFRQAGRIGSIRIRYPDSEPFHAPTTLTRRKETKCSTHKIEPAETKP